MPSPASSFCHPGPRGPCDEMADRSGCTLEADQSSPGRPIAHRRDQKHASPKFFAALSGMVNSGCSDTPPARAACRLNSLLRTRPDRVRGRHSARRSAPASLRLIPCKRLNPATRIGWWAEREMQCRSDFRAMSPAQTADAGAMSSAVGGLGQRHQMLRFLWPSRRHERRFH